MSLLDAVLLLPLIGFLALLFLPQGTSRNAALAISLLVFVISLGLIGPYWFATPTGYAFSTNSAWIDYPPIRYHVGLDGLSLWLVLLTTLLTPIAILVSWKSVDHRVKEFHAFLILLEFGLIGVFVSLDLFLFYTFWEISLVPMYFLIGIWGHDRRIYATVKFFLYTMAGSMLMLGSIIYLYNKSGSFDYLEILSQLQTGRLVLDAHVQMLLFLAFFLAFAVKVPLFPLHTWLPDAHVEAPTAGSVMLASVMLKMGTYGLVRYCLPLFPDAARQSAPWVAALAIIGIIYGALVAMVQPNMKKLVAYSSVSHLGFVVLGIFSFTQQGLDGAVYQMLNHGVSTGALFMLVGYLYERRHSLEISAYGGVATPAPNLAIVFLITTLASIGLPMLNNFVGEYLVLQGVAQANFTWTAFAALGVILSACYMLWLYQRTFYGKASESVSHHMFDLTPREWLAIAPLLLLMVWMGTFTQSFMPAISTQNARILQDTQKPKVERVQLPVTSPVEVSRAR
ncbi:MAG TPA: NADH-quinone oxidoreductase subunit M [Bryobacteraceae bacterium]|jgi:NADH-quinone oxidoreductase subunit M|nr:NADH-quinone oxidoreductase subunit M [Bryobacteraceae bacterium]